MNQQKLFSALGSRPALNLYFWVILFLIKYPDADDQTAYPALFYYVMMLGLMLFFAALSYLNNLVLLPWLWFKRKRYAYLLAVFLLVLLVSFVFTYTLKILPHFFPLLDPLQVSIVMSPVTTDTSFTGVVSDMQTYFAVMLAWTTVFALLGIYHHSHQQIQQMEQTINRHREEELRFLKSQINPHFLFNTLNNIYGLAIKKSDETADTILKLSSVLRYLLYDSEAQLIEFNKEKEVLFAYIDIELLRLPDNPNHHFSVNADKPYQLPPLLWLPVLENIFKHTRSISNPVIHFDLRILQDVLHLQSHNTCLAQSSDSSNKGGIGLTNLRKRLDLLYPGKYELKEGRNGEMYHFELMIHLSE